MATSNLLGQTLPQMLRINSDRLIVPATVETVAFTASISKPIHNVKEGANRPLFALLASNAKLLSSSLEILISATFTKPRGGAYRDRTDDPLLAKQVLSQLS
jgi:hypothetical protein